MLAVSTDSIETHERWIGTSAAQGGLGGLSFPLASDSDGTACRAYEVYVPAQHLAMRGLFIIDGNGVLQYQVVHNLSVGRGVDEILRVLEALQTGGICSGERGQAPLDVAQEFRPGRTIGTYRIEQILGTGSFGTVFRAHDVTLDRMVALKALRTDSRVPPDALLSEARAAAALNHANVCTIHTVDSTLGVPMIVMEYIAGRSLSELLKGQPLSQENTVSIGRQVALGLAAAHTQGVVHGDLKPANVLITAEGIAKVMDFGMARRAKVGGDTAATIVWEPAAPSSISGTPAYMAPEQWLGQPPTPASDVYALGLILYEMVSGCRARPESDILHIYRTIAQEDFTRCADSVPEPIAGVLRLALVTLPEERRITMSQIADRLA